MKSRQAFTAIKILNKLNIMKDIKELFSKQQNMENEKNKLYAQINISNKKDIEKESNRLEGLLKSGEITEEDLKTQQNKFFGDLMAKNPDITAKLEKINSEIGSLNFSFMEIILGAIPKAEDEIYKFVADYKEITKKEVEDGSIDLIINTFKEVATDSSFLALFNSMR